MMERARRTPEEGKEKERFKGSARLPKRVRKLMATRTTSSSSTSGRRPFPDERLCVKPFGKASSAARRRATTFDFDGALTYG